MTLVGYEPGRIERLHRRTLAAIDGLAAIRCDDPAALDALRAVRLMRQNLEQAWLPLLAAIRTSDAMTRWRALGPVPVDADRTWWTDLREVSLALGAGVTAALADLSDEQLVHQLLDTADELRTSWPDDLGAVHRRFFHLLGEAGRRASAEPGFTDRLDDAHLLRLVEAYDRVADAVRVEPVDGRDPDAVAESADGLAQLLGARAERRGADDPWWRANLPATTGIAAAMAAAPHAFPPGMVHDTARWYLDFLDTEAAITVGATTRHRTANSLLLAVARSSPAEAFALLDDPRTFRTVATEPWVEELAVEELLVAGLGVGPRVGGVDPLDGAAVLARLVTLADDDRLRDGARVGTALALPTYLPHLAPLLGQKEDDGGRSTVTIAVPSDDGLGIRGSRTIGTHAQLARLVGELLETERSQLALGGAIATYRAAVIDDLAEWLRTEAPDDPAAVHVEVGARLDGVHEVVELVQESADSQSQLLAVEHASRSRGLLTALSWASSGAALLGPPGRVAALASQWVTRVAAELTRLAGPSPLPVTGVEERMSTDLLVALVARPLEEPTLRAALGLDDVPPAFWDAVRERIDVLRADADPGARAVARDELRALLAGEPTFARYLALAERDQ